MMRLGNILIWLGVAAIVVGLAIRLGWLSWFGHLPGDIRSQGERGGLSFPITSSIVVSVLLTLILNVLARLFRDR
jgi:hypothetical protein